MMKWGPYTPEQSMGILRSTGCGQARDTSSEQVKRSMPTSTKRCSRPWCLLPRSFKTKSGT